jgi:hypothetical protein
MLACHAGGPGSIPGRCKIFLIFFFNFFFKGHNGIFSLSLLGDNSTFEISPSVAENAATFTIRVKNPALIDFEKTQQLRFKVNYPYLAKLTFNKILHFHFSENVFIFNSILGCGGRSPARKQQDQHIRGDCVHNGRQ